jgi:hypothetical protein
MAQAPPGGPPGTATPASGYPQWGVNSAHQIAEARNAAQKDQYIGQGYLEWFASRQAAQEGIAGQSGILGTGSVPGLKGLAAIGHFFSNLSQRGFWVRIAKVGIGAVMIIIGLGKVTGAPAKIEVAAGRVAKGALA